MNASEIKELRKKLGLAQEKFATLVGVSRNTVTKWEKGERSPSHLAKRRLEELMNEA